MAKKKEKPSKKDDIIEFCGHLASFGLEGLKESGKLEEVKRADQYYNGDHYIKNRSPAKGNFVDNKFAEILDNRIAHITDSRPKWLFLPQEESDTFTALALNQILGDVVWDHMGWDEKAEDSVRDASYVGTTHIKTRVDQNTGFPIFDVCQCGTVLPDPKAIRKEDQRFIIHVSAKSLDYIATEYDRHDIEPETEIDKTSSGGRGWHTKVVSSGGAVFPWVFPVVFGEVGQYTMENVWGRDKGGQDRTQWMTDTLVWEFYFDDRKREKIKFDPAEVAEEHFDFGAGKAHPVTSAENHVEHLRAHQAELARTDPGVQPRKYQLLEQHILEHGEYPPDESKAKFPNGRLVTISQGKLLRDVPNPLPIPWRDIFIKWDIFRNPRKYWGKSIVKDLYDMQDMLNHSRNSIHQNINLCTNGYGKYHQSMQDWVNKNKSKLNNIVGKLIPFHNSPDEFKMEFGEPLPQHFFQEMVMLESTMERRSGDEGPAAGRYPQGSPPGITVSQLLQEGKTVVRMMLRHYSTALKQMARNAIPIMDKHVSMQQRFRIMGQDNKPQLVKWEDLRNKGGKMDIRVDVATMLSSSRQERFRQAVELAQAGVYDAMAVLDAIDDPKKYEVAERLNIVNQLQAQNQQLVEENQKMEKIINTMENRQQTEGGQGNVGQ
jgi:hypothetical protein